MKREIEQEWEGERNRKSIHRNGELKKNERFGKASLLALLFACRVRLFLQRCYSFSIKDS